MTPVTREPKPLPDPGPGSFPCEYCGDPLTICLHKGRLVCQSCGVAVSEYVSPLPRTPEREDDA